MTVTIIAAIADNGIIGRDNDVPWHLPADLQRFKALTTGHVVVMGRKTFDSIDRRPLPNRRCIVVSHNPDYSAEGVETATSVNEAVDRAAGEDVFIAGGRAIYEEGLKLADEMQLTRIHAQVDGDISFPAFATGDWDLVRSDSHAPDEKHSHSFTFEHYKRRPL